MSAIIKDDFATSAGHFYKLDGSPAYTITGEKMVLLDKIAIGTKTNFEHVFEGVENRVHAIFVFLSVLELIQEQQIRITIGEGYNNFWLEKADPNMSTNIVLDGQEN